MGDWGRGRATSYGGRRMVSCERSRNVPSLARVAAGAFGFLTLIQAYDGLQTPA